MDFNEHRARQRGIIQRRKRDPRWLTENQARMAIDFADLYDVSVEQAGTYLDYYHALKRRWISPEQFKEGTSIDAPMLPVHG